MHKLVLITFLVFALPGFSQEIPSYPPGPAADTISIEIKNLQFVPNRVVVAPGTNIHWINHDPVDHDVTSGVSLTGRKSRELTQTRFPDDKFASGLFGEGKSFSITMNDRGEYQYFCNIHPFMTASIIVE